MEKKTSKLLETKQTLETGMKVVEFKGNIVSKLKPMTAEEKAYSASEIAGYIDRVGNPKNLMLLSNELRYFTIFKNVSRKNFAKKIFEFIDTDPFLQTIGEVKLIDADKDLSHVEVWIGNTFFALFDCDSLMVEL